MDDRRARARMGNERCGGAVTGGFAGGRHAGPDQHAQHGDERLALDRWKALEHTGDCTADRTGYRVRVVRVATGTGSRPR